VRNRLFTGREDVLEKLHGGSHSGEWRATLSERNCELLGRTYQNDPVLI
jgi:hypothetical protein